MPVDPSQRSAAVRRLLSDTCGSTPEVTDEAVAAELAESLDTVLSARAHVRQILVDSEEAGAEVRRRLHEGEDFVELSRELSRSPNASEGGELGLIAQGTLVTELDEVIFSLAAGEISEPVQGPGGYHVFQVLEVIPEGPPERHEAELAAAERLRERLARDHVRTCVERLANEVGAKVYVDQLWFEYDGRYAEADHALQ